MRTFRWSQQEKKKREKKRKKKGFAVPEVSSLFILAAASFSRNVCSPDRRWIIHLIIFGTQVLPRSFFRLCSFLPLQARDRGFLFYFYRQIQEARWSCAMSCALSLSFIPSVACEKSDRKNKLKVRNKRRIHMALQNYKIILFVYKIINWLPPYHIRVVEMRLFGELSWTKISPFRIRWLTTGKMSASWSCL